MAAVKFLKGSEEWMMFMDFWKICQEYWQPEKNDTYWESLVKETDKFYDTYKNFPLAKRLAESLVDTLEEKMYG